MRIREITKVLVPLSFMLSIPVVNIFYGVLNNADRGVYSLVTSVDDAIPFIKSFVIPYMAWYPFMMLTMFFFCIKDLKTYTRALISINIGLITSYLFFFFFQTTVPRPPLEGNDFITQFLNLVYSMDKPYNCFPSIHVLTCHIMVAAINKSSAKNAVNRGIIYFMSAIIIISTLFIKQHVILDVVSGIILGDVIYKLVFLVHWETWISSIKRFFLRLFMGKKIKVNKEIP